MAAHDKSTAFRRAAFIDAAVHAAVIQGRTPGFFIPLHDAQPIGEMHGEMRGNGVVWSKNDRATAAGRVT